MPTYKELLSNTKKQIREIGSDELKRTLEATAASVKPAVIDVREADELQAGVLPGAIPIPRGYLELRIEEKVPDKASPVVIYCAAGVRSAFAARTLEELGYTDVASLRGGFNRWSDQGFPIEKRAQLSAEQKERYRRHLIIPEVGESGQQKLLAAKVLLMGAGGLGSPAALYLAAAGAGTIGIIDMDVVELSNLQRQVIHGQKALGKPKTESAAERIRERIAELRALYAQTEFPYLVGILLLLGQITDGYVSAFACKGDGCGAGAVSVWRGGESGVRRPRRGRRSRQHPALDDRQQRRDRKAQDRRTARGRRRPRRG